MSTRDDAESKMEDGVAANPADRDWLSLARVSFEHSTDFMNANIRVDWEKSLDHFNSKHAAGSKYLSQEYKHRSKLFRPKTRAVLRRHEAAAAASFFSTQDVVNIAATDDSDPRQLAAAEVMNGVVNYRLTKTIPWFRILMGGYQTANIQGIVVSKQFWEYEEREETILAPVIDPFSGGPVVDPETGMPAMETRTITKPVRDEPVLQLMPPENVRIHEGADWLAPIDSSPFLIVMHPMFVGEVKARIASGEWIEVDESALRAALVDETSSIREKREGYDRIDNNDGATEPVQDHELVWVHENFIRDENGDDQHYWTLETKAMLSDPKPVTEVYPHLDEGERPYVMGYGNLEAFRIYPSSKVQQLHDLQVKANEVENLRLDNVKFALHPMVRVKASKTVDMKALSLAIPGKVQAFGDPANDVVYDRPPEVTQSSYAEQDRVNMDFDELAGSFSSTSVSSNRQIGETAAGMGMMSNAANALTEYDLRVFSETWVEPVLKQLVKMEQHYETDATVLLVASKAAQTLQQMGIDPMSGDVLQGDLTVTVNVGIGSTDPVARMARFSQALQGSIGLMNTLAPMFGPMVAQSPGYEAVTKELFGMAGYKDGARFLDFRPPQPPGPPQPPQPTPDAVVLAQVEQQKIAQKDQESKLALQQKEIAAQRDMELRRYELERKLELEERTKAAELMLKASELGVKEDANQTNAIIKNMEMKVSTILEAIKLSDQKESRVQKMQFDAAGRRIREMTGENGPPA